MAGPEYRHSAGCSFSSCSRNLLVLRSNEHSQRTHSSCTPNGKQRTARRAQQSPPRPRDRNVEGCIHTKRPGRRKSASPRSRSPTTAKVLTASIICFLVPGSVAYSRPTTGDSSRISVRRRSPETALAAQSSSNDDRVLPATPPGRMRFEPRQDESAEPPETTITVPALTTTTASRSGKDHKTVTVTSTSSLAVASSPLSIGSLPKPFDTNLGNNFTSTCLPFFQSMLDNQGFNECTPFSLLLQNSQGFFQAEKSLVTVTQVLDASCDANFDRCNGLMSGYAIQLRDQGNCGTDFQQGNPVVAQAYYGLISYQTMYQAGCLRDSSGSYCFADAVTNSSSISDTYPYYLPLHMDLPGGARPTCDTCLQQTMEGFANAATNGSQPVSSTYMNAAQQINVACGPNFVSTDVQVTTGAASAVAVGSLAPLVALGAVMLHWLL